MARGDATRGSIRLALFAAALALLAGVAAFVGRASGIEIEGGADEMAHETRESTRGAGANGLSDTGSGLRLRIEPSGLRAGEPSRLRLSIRDGDGAAVRELRGAEGEPPLHLILVRRDLTGYQHLHPRPSGDGFAAEVTLPRAGVWRAYADFELEGRKVVLGRDLLVAGDFVPQSPPALARSADVDGYRIELDEEGLRAGAEATPTFAISRGGRAIEGLQPYLGAAGHLVAIREDDLAYLHVHPLDGSRPGEVAFGAELDEPGRYALYLQFKHAGLVHTARFVVAVSR